MSAGELIGYAALNVLGALVGAGLAYMLMTWRERRK